jgi:hypothetical protein
MLWSATQVLAAGYPARDSPIWRVVCSATRGLTAA